MEPVPLISTIAEFGKLITNPENDRENKFRIARTVKGDSNPYKWAKQWPSWKVSTHTDGWGVCHIYVQWKGDNR